MLQSQFMKSLSLKPVLVLSFVGLAVLLAIGIFMAKNTKKPIAISTSSPTVTAAPVIDDDHNTSTSKYKLVPETPVILEARKPTPIRLQVFDWETRTPLQSFLLTHHESMHLSIVNDTLNWFSHTHPVRTNTYFDDMITFPNPGTYYVYATMNPEGVGETTLSTTIQVNGLDKKILEKESTSLISVEMRSPERLSIEKFLNGDENFRFQVIDPKTGNSVPTMETYQEELGQLVMIGKENLAYSHFHPDRTQEQYNANTAKDKDISFLVNPKHTEVSPGQYRLFLELSRGSTVHQFFFDVEFY